MTQFQSYMLDFLMGETAVLILFATMALSAYTWNAGRR